MTVVVGELVEHRDGESGTGMPPLEPVHALGDRHVPPRSRRPGNGIPRRAGVLAKALRSRSPAPVAGLEPLIGSSHPITLWPTTSAITVGASGVDTEAGW